MISNWASWLGCGGELWDVMYGRAFPTAPEDNATLDPRPPLPPGSRENCGRLGYGYVRRCRYTVPDCSGHAGQDTAGAPSRLLDGAAALGDDRARGAERPARNPRPFGGVSVEGACRGGGRLPRQC